MGRSEVRLSAAELADAVRQKRDTTRAELAALVEARSIADERQAPRSECLRAATWVRDALRDAGVTDADLVDTPDGSPAVIGYHPGPPGSPTVLLYSHYDVQPAGDPALWHSDPFVLTERDGRWFGRGSADCKGNIMAHLLALRAFAGRFPVGLRIVVEGSEEMGTGGLEELVRDRPELFEADLIVVVDAGNVECGVPTVTTSLRGIANVVIHVETLSGAVHSGMFGGPAPDALAALVAALASLRDDEGNTIVDGLPTDGLWSGAEYPEDRFRTDAGVLDGVRLAGSATVAESVWARPAVTVTGIDCPSVVGAAAAVVPRASAAVNLRVPPGMDPAHAQDALIEHLRAHVPYGARVSFEREGLGLPFRARTDGAGYAALADSLRDAFGKAPVASGQGGSIPLCTALAQQFPDAEIALIGVEEPRCRIHAANESVDPEEIERIAVAEALLLQRLGG